MEEKNELNDIILNKNNSGSGTKKLLLAITALTLILIIVLVIMNSLKSESNEAEPKAAAIPEPTSPTEVIDDPLFEPVEVIQEGANESAPQDLGQIAQKIKQESYQNAGVASAPTASAPTQPVQQTTPAVPQPKPSVQTVPAVNVPKAQPQTAPAPQPKPVVQTAPAKPQPAPKPTQNVVNTPTIKTNKPVEPKAATVAPKPATTTIKAAATPAKTTSAPVTEKPAAPKTAEKVADSGGTYYIQVGSFSKEPDKKLFERLNASGLKYTTAPNGSMTKVMVGPFQGEKAARDVLGTVKRNVEAGAYITKG